MVQNVGTTAKSVIGGRRATNKRPQTTTGLGMRNQMEKREKMTKWGQ